jgi:hypothetical protein
MSKQEQAVIERENALGLHTDVLPWLADVVDRLAELEPVANDTSRIDTTKEGWWDRIRLGEIYDRGVVGVRWVLDMLADRLYYLADVWRRELDQDDGDDVDDPEEYFDTMAKYIEGAREAASLLRQAERRLGRGDPEDARDAIRAANRALHVIW